MKSYEDTLFVDYLLTLSNYNFYSLVSNYLGNTAESKNKHQIAENLVIFLQSQEILDALCEYLNHKDRIALATIDLWASIKEEHYHKMSLPIPETQLQNFLERLLVIRHQEKIILNPVLKDFFEKQDINAHILFQVNTLEKIQENFWLTDRVMMLSLSFFFHEKEGKKSKNLWEKIFPHLPAKFEEILYTAYLKLHLIDEDREPNLQKIQAFSELDQLTRIAFVIAAYSSHDETDIPYIAQTLYQILQDFSDTAILSEIFLYSYVLQHQLPPRPQILIRIQECEIFKPIDEITEFVVLKKIHLTTDQGFLVIESDHTAVLMENPPFSASIIFAFKPTLNDIMTHLTTSAEICATAFKIGFTAQNLISDLQQYAANSIPQSFASTLERFEIKFRRVRLYAGYLLHIDTDIEKRINSFLEANKNLEKIAPCVYLLNEYPCAELIKVFKAAGIEPPILHMRKKDIVDSLRIDKIIPQSLHPYITSNQNQGAVNEEAYKEKLRKIAGTTQQKMRIDQGLILHADQLLHPVTHSNISAQSTDFSHKMNIVQQAVHDKFYLEISIHVADVMRHIVVKPTKIEKNDGKAILLGINYKTQKPVKLHIAHILSVSILRPTLMKDI
ncbi:MAG: hypothetical protein ACRCVN_02135 [Spirochaetia bacterium]